jgi:hypothetical protein
VSLVVALHPPDGRDRVKDVPEKEGVSPMNIDDPHWEDYERRFRALAEEIPLHKGADLDLGKAKIHLCLYGENGLEPEQELEILNRLEKDPSQLKGLEMTTSYWEDLVLYLL